MIIAPSSPPDNIQVTLLPNNTLVITWDPPPKAERRGQLKGYKVGCRCGAVCVVVVVVDDDDDDDDDDDYDDDDGDDDDDNVVV